MATFSDCKVGDRVWDLRFGWGKVISTNFCDDWPLEVEFEGINRGSTRRSYSYGGKEYESFSNPTLFWSEVKIVPPERPKEHICDFLPALDSTHEWEECYCGLARGYKPKEKCEACERLEKYSSPVLESNDIRFLLNQHHTCSKGEK